MGSVTGKVVLITGAANGIGAEVAERLHRKAAKLVLVDLDEERLEQVARRLRDSGGPDTVHTVVGDVRDYAAMQSAADQGVERFGGIDVVMANAGIATYGSVLQVDPKAFQTLMDVNVVGVFNTVRAALPSIIDRRGYVLIVSSAAAYAAAPGMAPYDAAKAAVEHFANALRLEVGYRGVAVGSAHMLWIDTPLVRESREDLPSSRESLSRLPGPLGRTTSVAECAEAFVEGIEQRKRQINCPRIVGLLRWLKPLLASPLGEAVAARDVAELLPRMDAEVAALGRSMSARTQELENRG
ncbi:polysaccharide biosynthesis family protein [Mycolicibacterium hassiacum DSM 44199]|jgi:NAD(P)-dependent dehydrogenase (short-subunit alcohol dehydrogenase family)|uniref:Polysaccharide biosynthesis family protein n=1 Tax=Mycolicibacterium hassiacum (strain DSM 44199 / CIP 105218 / JCM 12690 / 3849) TaxID=1122247 RepID=K5B6Y8_MYCHD|nr:SDR family oxidoreductase [Mycolicibacterium hassiacum]EKF21023.1 polysaccharide biosynthesis family protein [Mycolicibacterium hassiacum DSM 44199]MBX5487958.1 SDR family oxidoreductase [Mycolicibacterium hassiacum]MDA4084656.1 short-chain dehydrogenase [Mycolicibacterium hassiacum DSM 44199]VCT89878.1 putative NAD-dependent oxidoreductase [Mycolicibacterium hassiacum DSM 44199]